jgi:hypothetical protein
MDNEIKLLSPEMEKVNDINNQSYNLINEDNVPAALALLKKAEGILEVSIYNLFRISRMRGN